MQILVYLIHIGKNYIWIIYTRFPVNAAIGICKFMEKKNTCLCPDCKPLNTEENGNEIIKTNEDDTTNTHTRPSKEVYHTFYYGSLIMS
jgi:hypothetical protein